MGLKFTRLVDKDVIPTKVSQLENDSNYQNEEQVDAKVNAITKENLGLDKVDNTSDMDKPISTLTQKALDEKENKSNLGDLAYKDSISKSDIGLGNVNNVAITQEEVTQIGTNKTNIENTNKQVETNIQHISNAQSTANEALNIAKGRARTKVFDTFGDMTNYLKSASKEEFKLGDNLLIKATNVPDYWISNILDNNSGIYGYYEISILETQKVPLDDFYNKDEIDTKETNINNKIDKKANSSDVYPKEEVDNKIKVVNDNLEKYKQDIGTYGLTPVFDRSDYGYIENVYINTSLSINEVISMIDTLDEKCWYGNVYYVFRTKTYTLNITKDYHIYAHIKTDSGSTRQADIFNTNTGFKNNYFTNEVIEVNEQQTPYASDPGTQNEKLVNLFSLAPFFEESTLVQKVYSLDKSLDNYYKKEETYSKSETYSQNEIDTQLANKVGYDTFESVLTQASQQISAIAETVEDVNERIDMGSVTEIGAVPNSGTLDTLYINTSMSTSEVNALIDQVGTYYSQLGGRLYQVLQNVDNDTLMIMLSNGTNYQIMFNLKGSLVTIYENGWILNKLPEGYENGIYIGSELVSSSSAIGITVSVGHKNSQLIDLFYTEVSKPIPINEEVKNNTQLITKLDKQLNAKVGGSGGGGSGGAIPNSGYVDTVYINTNLSTEQVLDIIALDKLDYVLLAEEETGEKMYAYFVLGTEPTTPTAVEDGFDTMIGIMLMTDADDNVFASQIIGSVVTTNEDDDGDRVIWYYDIEMGGGMFDPQGIGISEFIVQGEAMTEAMGMSAGTSNDKLVDLMNIGATSGSPKSFYEKMNELYDYVGQAKSGATTVPNSGTIEKIYFNTSLSAEEVVNILSQLDYHDFAGSEAYCIVFPENIDVALLVMRRDGVYGILNIFAENELDGTYFFSEDVGNGIVGWKEGFDGVIEINDTVSDYQGYYELPLGEQNDKLTNLVSLTPSFEKAKTLTERVENIEKELNGYEISGGTAVPSSGMVENIYFNKSLSANELYDLLSSLQYVDGTNIGYAGYNLCFIFGNEDFSKGLYIWDTGSSYEVLYFENGVNNNVLQVTYDKEISWYENIGDFITFNENNVLGTLGASIGLIDYNDKLSSLFSITPFGSETIKGLIERVSELEKNGGGGSLPTDPTFDSIKLENEEDDAKLEITPYGVYSNYGTCTAILSGEETGVKVVNNDTGGYSSLVTDKILYSNGKNGYDLFFPQNSGTFVVANEYGVINLIDPNGDAHYMELSPYNLYLEENYVDDDGSGFGYSCSTNSDGHRSNYYDDENDVCVYMNAQNQQFGIEEYNYGQSTYYKNGGIEYFNTNGDGFNYYFPEKTGTLATLDDIQEGGTKIQILTWEDDD